MVLSVIVTIADEEYTDYTAKVQGEDKSEDVSIIDVMGLQSDGTGIIGDTLRISYGASFGTVTSVSWYKDGAVVKTQGSGNNGITFDYEVGATQGVGTYKATVVADGQLYETNEIVITNKEEQAEILDFTIEDDYTDGKAITYGTDDNFAIVTVTLNKNYNGKFELFKANDSKYSKAINNFQTSTAAAAHESAYYVTTAAGGTDHAAPTAHSSVLTTDTPTNFQIVNLKTNTDNALGHINADGTVTYKFLANGGTLTRGSDYIITFDQNTVLTDKPGQGNENVSDAATVPYVTAPASIAVTKVATANKPEVTFYDAAGEVLTWFGADGTALNAAGISSGDVYYAKEKTTDTAKATGLGSKLGAANVTKGVWTSDQKAGTDAYWFAQFETTKGIFAAKSAKLTSEAVQIAKGAADMINLREKGTDTVDNAKTATVEFANLRADGTVYIVRGASDAANVNAIYGKYTAGVSEYIVATADVKAGTSSLDIANALDVYSATPGENMYIAVFEPDDSNNYGMIYTEDGLKNTWKLDTDDDVPATKTDSQGLTVKQTAVTLDWDKDTKGTAAVVQNETATVTLTGTTLKAKDQFGEAMKQAEAAKKNPIEMTKVDTTLTTTEKGTFNYSTAANTSLVTVTLNIKDFSIDKGDGFKFTLLGQNVEVTKSRVAGTDPVLAVDAGAVGVSSELTIKIGGNTFCDTSSHDAADEEKANAKAAEADYITSMNKNLTTTDYDKTTQTAKFDVSALTGVDWANATVTSATAPDGVTLVDDPVAFDGANSTIEFASGAAENKKITINVKTELGNAFVLYVTTDEAYAVSASFTPNAALVSTSDLSTATKVGKLTLKDQYGNAIDIQTADINDGATVTDVDTATKLMGSITGGFGLVKTSGEIYFKASRNTTSTAGAWIGTLELDDDGESGETITLSVTANGSGNSSVEVVSMTLDEET